MLGHKDLADLFEGDSVNQELVILVENLTKEYRTGMIGGATLRADLQSLWARMRGKEDPNLPVNSERYAKSKVFNALENINLRVNKGERVGIIGGNGAGKSTLLKIISRITAPTVGTIKLKGRVASMLEVGTGFHGELTGRENIYLNGSILGMSKAEVDKKIETIIDFSECRQFIDTPVKRYSSGMYVKLAFAVAAHLDADILIMDEVLAVGDMAFQEKCLGKMDEVSTNEGKTILYVSHNMSTIQRLCNRCIVIDKGKIIFDGDTDKAVELYLNNVVKHEFSRDYLTDLNSSGLFKETLRIEHAAYLNHDSIRFTDDEKIQLLLKWHCYEDVEDLCFRFEIWSTDRVAVASSMVFDIGSFAAGEIAERVFTVDISSLVPGTYSGYYCMFRKGSLGACENLDRVPALYFCRINSVNDIMWNYRLWGRMRLEDPIVNEVDS